ncbi:neuropeptides capa receptor [Atheta coriaria]|uniref:neuropeptides capa receptor n=1 Tax=Dalotia coriaria TaxID=877792 RepID=UPI0031F352C0
MNESDFNFNIMSNLTVCDHTSPDYDVWLCLQIEMGPQTLSLQTAVPLTILNVIIFVTGLVGNISVCLVIVKHSNLHTVTNYYLFNLAISDLTLLIFGLPYDVAVYWHQYPWVLGNAFCKFRALLSEWASYVSVLTIVAFSTERYFSICYPLYLYKMGGLQRAIRIISGIWFLSFFAALPFSFYTRVEYIQINNYFIEESAFCGMLSHPPIPLAALSTIIFFLIPMVIIIFEYSMMGYKIAHRSNLQFGDIRNVNNVHRDRTRAQSHKAIVRMLAVVVVAFFICWAPFHAQRLNYKYGMGSPYFSIINEWMYFITGLLYYFSSTLNPILYNVMSNRYRCAFREILCGAAPSTNNSVVRNSTIRETRLPSGNMTERLSTTTSRNGHANNVATKEDDPMVVQNREIKLGKNTQLICELNYSVIKPNSETCI